MLFFKLFSGIWVPFFFTTGWHYSKAAKTKTDQSLSDFQTGIGAAAYAILDTEQLILCTKLHSLSLLPSYSILIERLFQLQNFTNYLIKIHDILNNVVSNQVGNTSCILAYLYNSASMQHCYGWASQLPFLHNFKDTAPQMKFTWSLTQAQHQSSLGMSQSSTPMKSGKTIPRADF